MKNAILFAIIAISTTAFTQNNHSATKMQHRVANSMEEIQNRILEKGTNPISTSYENVFLKTDKQKTQQQNYLVQMNDSILHYPYIVPWYGWDSVPTKKTIQIEYDNHENLIGYINQVWSVNTWQNSERYAFIFDENDNLISDLYQKWVDTSWKNYQQCDYTYDSNNNEIIRVRQEWNDYDYYYSVKITSLYDENNNLISETGQEWIDNNWIFYSRLSYTYDSNNNQLSILWEDWINGEWENYYYVNFTYDYNNYMISELDQEWKDNIWVVVWETTFFYDSNYNLIKQLIKLWDGVAWTNSDQNINTYDNNNNLTSYLWQTYINDILYNLNQGTFLYDSNNNLTYKLDQNWNGNKWVKTWEYSSTYDENNFKLSYTNKHYDYNFNHKVTVGDSAYYYFHVVVEIPEKHFSKVNEAIVYPNPGSNLLHILFPVESQLWTFQLFDMNGKLVLQQKITDQCGEINTDFIPPGTYIYHISNSNGLFESGKWVKQ